MFISYEEIKSYVIQAVDHLQYVIYQARDDYEITSHGERQLIFFVTRRETRPAARPGLPEMACGKNVSTSM